METNKKPTSIKVIYWITQVIFWLFAAASLLLFGIAIAFLLEIFDKTQLHVGVPIGINVVEKGSVILDQTLINVEFKELYGKIYFIDTPSFIGKTYSFFILIILSISLYIFMTFRSFITNVYMGQYFQRKNIFLLKRISYALIGVWLFTVFYAYFQYFYLVKNLNFETIEITSEVQTYPVILLVALFIWVLSHILLKGVELQEENKLTI